MSSDVAVELLALKRDAVVPFGVVGPDPTLERPGGGRRQEHHYAGGAGGPNTPKSKATPRTKLPSVHQLDAEVGASHSLTCLTHPWIKRRCPRPFAFQTAHNVVLGPTVRRREVGGKW